MGDQEDGDEAANEFRKHSDDVRNGRQGKIGDDDRQQIIMNKEYDGPCFNR